MTSTSQVGRGRVLQKAGTECLPQSGSRSPGVSLESTFTLWVPMPGTPC